MQEASWAGAGVGEGSGRAQAAASAGGCRWGRRIRSAPTRPSGSCGSQRIGPGGRMGPPAKGVAAERRMAVTLCGSGGGGDGG